MPSLAYISDYPLPTIKPEGQQGLSICEALASHGVKVLLLVPEPPGHRLNQYEIDTYYGDLQHAFETEGFRDVDLAWLDSLPWHLSRWATILGQLARSARIAVYSRSKMVDVCYTRNPLIAWWLAKLNQSVILEMMTMPSHSMQPLLRSLCRSRHVKLIIAITKHMAEDVGILIGHTDKLKHLSIGVDVERFSAPVPVDVARQELDLPAECPLVVYTGGLRSDRGVDVIVHSASMSPGVEFVLVGGRPDEISRMQALATELRVGNLTFTGYVPHSRVSLYQKAADILLLIGSTESQHQARHASYAKLFEYMASGRPIIASDLPSVREILTNEENALLVQPGCARALSEAIERLLRQKELVDRMSYQAGLDVQRYSWENRTAKILQLGFPRFGGQ